MLNLNRKTKIICVIIIVAVTATVSVLAAGGIVKFVPKKETVSNNLVKATATSTTGKITATVNPDRNKVKETSDISTEKKAQQEKLFKHVQEQKLDNFEKQFLSKEYGKTEDELMELKEELGSWPAVSKKLRENKIESKKLTVEELEDLVSKGYGLNDIEKAEELSSKCNKTVQEILDIKTGKLEMNKRNDQIPGASELTWEAVTDILGIKSDAENFGIPKEKVKEMKAAGLSDVDIIRIGTICFNFNKDSQEVWNLYKKGMGFEEIRRYYSGEK